MTSIFNIIQEKMELFHFYILLYENSLVLKICMKTIFIFNSILKRVHNIIVLIIFIVVY